MDDDVLGEWSGKVDEFGIEDTDNVELSLMFWEGSPFVASEVDGPVGPAWVSAE